MCLMEFLDILEDLPRDFYLLKVRMKVDDAWSTKNLIIKKTKKDLLKWVTKYTIPQEVEILSYLPLKELDIDAAIKFNNRKELSKVEEDFNSNSNERLKPLRDKWIILSELAAKCPMCDAIFKKDILENFGIDCGTGLITYCPECGNRNRWVYD